MRQEKGLMLMQLIKVTVKLSLEDVLRLKRTYAESVINSLPVKVAVGTTTWYISENTYKTMLNYLNKN